MSTAKADLADTPRSYAGVLHVALDRIRPSAVNPRRDLGDIGELAESIKHRGLLEPLVVTPTDDDTSPFELVAGERRMAALRLAGFARADCVVQPAMADDEATVEAMLTENCQRKELTPCELGSAVARLLEHGRTQRAVASLIGVSQGHVSRLSQLSRLPDVARAAVDASAVTIEQGVALSKLPADKVEGLFAKGNPAPYVITEAVARHGREQKVEAAQAEAEAKGWPVVEDVDHRDGPWLVAWLRWAGDYEVHESEPCHALLINSDGSIQSVCTDRSRHERPVADEPDKPQGSGVAAGVSGSKPGAPAGPGAAPQLGGPSDRRSTPGQRTPEEIKAERDAENARRAQERAENASRQEQAKADRARRIAFHRHLVGLVGVNKILGLAAVMLPMAGDDNLADVARALGIPLFEATVRSEPGCDDPTCCDAEACPEIWVAECTCGDEAIFDTQPDAVAWAAHAHQEVDDPEREEVMPKLHSFADRDIRNEAQVVYALALTVGESYAEPKATRWGAEHAVFKGIRRRYLEHLAAEGYELSDLEREWLAAAQSEPEACICTPDACLEEGTPGCSYCRALDGEMRCPADPDEPEAKDGDESPGIDYGEILTWPQPSGPDRYLVECEACGGNIGLPAFDTRATAELARQVHSTATHSPLAIRVADRLTPHADSIPWPSVSRSYEAWLAALREDESGIGVDEARSLCGALASHRSHGGDIPWPEVVEALDAWQAAEAVAAKAERP